MKIRKYLGLKRRRRQYSPHKKSPNTYFKHIYFSKLLYGGIEYISKELERKSIRVTADKLMTITVREYMAGIIRGAAHYQVELNELYRRGFNEKNARLWIALLRKVVADREKKQSPQTES